MNQVRNNINYQVALENDPGLEWARKLDDFFTRRADDILFITKHLSGQRELWLHGEILLELGQVKEEDRSLLGMNEQRLYPGATADLFASNLLVAEIKLVSTHHQRVALLKRSAWGLGVDLMRLKNSTLRKETHLFILVVVEEGTPYKSWMIGDEVRTFPLPDGVIAQELDGFGPEKGEPVSIRLWKVTPEGAKKESEPKEKKAKKVLQ